MSDQLGFRPRPPLTIVPVLTSLVLSTPTDPNVFEERGSHSPLESGTVTSNYFRLWSKVTTRSINLMKFLDECVLIKVRRVVYVRRGSKRR